MYTILADFHGRLRPMLIAGADVADIPVRRDDLDLSRPTGCLAARRNCSKLFAAVMTPKCDANRIIGADACAYCAAPT